MPPQGSYKDFLKAVGITSEQAWEMTNNTDDIIEFDKEYALELSASDIHGLGLFSTQSFKTGDLICPSRTFGKRTPAGRYINHSATPNTHMVFDRGGQVINVIASKNIKRGEELTSNYFSNLSLLKGETMKLHEEQMVVMGNDAEQFLNSTVFTSVVNSLIEQSFNGYVNSAPQDIDQRNAVYYQYQALREIVDTIKQRVAIRDEIESKNESNSKTEEKE